MRRQDRITPDRLGFTLHGACLHAVQLLGCLGLRVILSGLLHGQVLLIVGEVLQLRVHARFSADRVEIGLVDLAFEDGLIHDLLI